MQDIVGQVLQVTGRTTRNGRTLYDVAFSDGQKYTVFEPALAAKAQSLMGQSVTARVEVKQNGQYTNYNLQDVAPEGGLPAQAFPAAAGVILPPPGVAAAAAVAGIPVTPFTFPPSPNSGSMTPERETKIVRQNVLGTAHNFVAQLFQGAGPESVEEASALAKEYARELFEIVYGSPEQAQDPSEVDVPVAVSEMQSPTPPW